MDNFHGHLTKDVIATAVWRRKRRNRTAAPGIHIPPKTAAKTRR